ncbi:MAG TPA: hypothetical protein VK501_02925, partial [Baekduia sp.]
MSATTPTPTEDDRRARGPAVLDGEHRGDGGAESADGTDRQVDLAEQQHEHHADRDQADGRDLQRQVDDVGGAEEPALLRLEDRPHDRQQDEDAQRAEIARADPVHELLAGGRQGLLLGRGGGWILLGGRG